MRWLFVMLLLAGCTVGPDHRAPIPAAPAAWREPAEAGAATELAGWWRRFDDPALSALVARAVAGDPGVEEAAARVREARAGLAVQRAAASPSLSGHADASRAAQANTGLAQGFAGARTQNSFSAGFDAAFEIDLFGGTRRRIESAAAAAEAEAADLHATLLSLVGDVARAYAEARGTEARLAVARGTLALRRDTAGLTRARSRAGLAPELDALRAEAEVANAAAQIAPLEQDLAAFRQRLIVLTGGAPVPELDQPAPVPRFAGSILPDPPAAVLARRPDVRRAERRLASANAEIGVAEAARYPAITLAGALGVNAARLRGANLATLQSWSFGPSLDVPLFDAGQRRATVAQKVAVRDQRLAAWRAVVLAAIEEAENALSALAAEQRQHAALRRAVAAYAANEALARAQYAGGLASFLDVLDAQRSLGTARDALAQSETRRATHAIAVFKALGGGWDGEM
jgi:NodT family efflux transporter outer membrane factor (OMF) lipoprotein